MARSNEKAHESKKSKGEGKSSEDKERDKEKEKEIVPSVSVPELPKSFSIALQFVFQIAKDGTSFYPQFFFFYFLSLSFSLIF